jgi:hypothetical protein
MERRVNVNKVLEEILVTFTLNKSLTFPIRNNRQIKRMEIKNTLDLGKNQVFE